MIDLATLRAKPARLSVSWLTLRGSRFPRDWREYRARRARGSAWVRVGRVAGFGAQGLGGLR